LSGIYLHIPFCRKACHYCDFHFSTNLKLKSILIEAIGQEINLRKDHVTGQDEKIRTVYFGGGTPSLMNKEEAITLMDQLKNSFDLAKCEEITLEANPEDINQANLEMWKEIGINRISLGVQSLSNSQLTFVNRNHTREKSIEAIRLVQRYFSNFTVDMMFGIPPFSLSEWENELNSLLFYDVPHLSIYSLTIEPRTAFGHWAKKGTLVETDESLMADAYKITHEMLTSYGYEHYEISNYAKKGFKSQHNSAYWSQKKYFGFGPGAHSFDGQSRAFNISSNSKYLKSIQNGNLPHEVERLTSRDRINEYILTGLRTSIGIDLNGAKTQFGIDLMRDHARLIAKWKENGLLKIENEHMRLTLDGMLFADEISSNMFYD
jgi:oxygen-independent coproporphyrinogen-3 oxidase